MMQPLNSPCPTSFLHIERLNPELFHSHTKSIYGFTFMNWLSHWLFFSSKKWFGSLWKPLYQSVWNLQERHLQSNRGWSFWLPKKVEMLQSMVGPHTSSHTTYLFRLSGTQEAQNKIKWRKVSKRKFFASENFGIYILIYSSFISNFYYPLSIKINKYRFRIYSDGTSLWLIFSSNIFKSEKAHWFNNFLKICQKTWKINKKSWKI